MMITEGSRKMMRDELRFIVQTDVSQLARLFGWPADGSLTAKLDAMPIVKNMDILFTYVSTARLPRTFPVTSVLDDASSYILGLHAQRFSWNSTQQSNGICSLVIRHAIARCAVDFESGTPLMVEELALLGDTDHRTVVNEVSVLSGDWISPCMDPYGVESVPRQHGLTWLKQRPAFLLTVFEDAADHQDSQNSFANSIALARFVRQRSATLGVSLSSVLAFSEMVEEFDAWAEGAQQDNLVELDAFRRMAKILRLDERPFIIAASKAVLNT